MDGSPIFNLLKAGAYLGQGYCILTSRCQQRHIGMLGILLCGFNNICAIVVGGYIGAPHDKHSLEKRTDR